MTIKFHECREMENERVRSEQEDGYYDEDWYIETTRRPVLSWGAASFECSGYFVINFCPFCGEKLT